MTSHSRAVNGPLMGLKNPDQLVVVLTGAGEEQFGLLALQAGAVGFLSKDVDIAALPRALTAVWEGRERSLGGCGVDRLGGSGRPPGALRGASDEAVSGCVRRRNGPAARGPDRECGLPQPPM